MGLIHQEDLLEDIAHMCGAPLIKKYLNPDIQKEDIDKGLAPTPETIRDFCGSADLVVSDLSKTKFINPKQHIRKALAKAYAKKKYVTIGGKK